MRRSLKRPRVKRVRPPKAIEAPRPDRPRRTNLKTIYKDIISSDLEQRVNTLRRALQWYDECIKYIGYKIEYVWPKPLLKQKNEAELARAAAIPITNDIQKEKQFLLAIKAYEKVVKSYKPPLIKSYLSKLK